jgi:hypothetical protein
MEINEDLRYNLLTEAKNKNIDIETLIRYKVSNKIESVKIIDNNWTKSSKITWRKTDKGREHRKIYMREYRKKHKPQYL